MDQAELKAAEAHLRAGIEANEAEVESIRIVPKGDGVAIGYVILEGENRERQGIVTRADLDS